MHYTITQAASTHTTAVCIAILYILLPYVNNKFKKVLHTKKILWQYCT